MVFLLSVMVSMEEARVPCTGSGIEAPCYDPDIANAMTLNQWRQIRSVIKLNDNDRAAKKGSPLYNPCYKYDLVYKAQVTNLNFVTLRAQKEQTGDEMTWKFMGYGERGTGVVSCIVGKPGVTRGGQIAFVTDAS